MVDRLLQFISLRLFPAKPEEFPPMVKCTWWIPSATKVLALFSRYFSRTVYAYIWFIYVYLCVYIRFVLYTHTHILGEDSFYCSSPGGD